MNMAKQVLKQMIQTGAFVLFILGGATIEFGYATSSLPEGIAFGSILVGLGFVLLRGHSK